jgi:hypothetical protein
MFRYIRQLLFAFLIIAFYQCSKLKIQLRELQENNSTMNNTVYTLTINNLSSPSDFCPLKSNCLYYGVSPSLENYDCLVCRKDYMLVYNSQGKASCTEKNEIQNCQSSIKKQEINMGKPYCIRCEKDFALKNETECISVPEEKKIEGCKDYLFSNNNYTCYNCDDGYYKDEFGLKCAKGCNPANCQTCKRVGHREFCLHCNPNMIGVYDVDTKSFRKCMTCDEYSLNLQIINSTYIPSL